MLELRTKGGDCYTLDGAGNVVARSNGPKGWDYSGKWSVVGFKKRWHSHATIPLGAALEGADVGFGYVVDLDHGHYRMWGGQGQRLASLRKVEA